MKTRPHHRRAWPARFAVLAGCVLLLAVAQAAAAASPIRWRWSNPRPHGGNVVDMAYSASLGLAVQVAERGQIFTSSDMTFWIPRDTGTSNDLRGVCFLGTRALVTGENGRVLFADQPDTWKFGSLNPGTTDWLEAVAASPVNAVAVGDSGSIYTTLNGSNWTKQTTGATADWLRGVAFGNTLSSGSGVFVAVGENGRILTSPTGSNWSAKASGTSQHFNRVGFSSLPTPRFIALAENGVCVYSTNNGTNWISEPIGATNDLFQAATATSGTGGGVRVIVGDIEARLTDFAGGWTNLLASPEGPTPWTYYAGISRQNYFLIAGRTGLAEEGARTNGGPVLWRPLDDAAPSVRNWLWDVTYPTNFYVAVGDRATVMISRNGVDWTPELVPQSLTNSIFLGVGGSTNMLVAVGSGGSLMISPDVMTEVTFLSTNGTNVTLETTNASAFGILWQAISVPTTNDLQGIAASDKLFVATGAAGTILTSPNATNWASIPPPTNRFLSGVTAWPHGWIATGDDGVIVSSADGVSWKVASAPNALTSDWLYRVRYLAGRLIAVGQNGTIVTSTNGTNWVKVSSGTTKWLNDVAFLDNTWFIVGNSGTVLTSSNAVNWAGVGTITRKNLYAAATDTMQLVTVGVEGVALRAQIVAETNAVIFLGYDHFTITNAYGAFAENLYLLAGQTDQQFTLDNRASFGTNGWHAGPSLEFFDGSATLFYLEMIPLTNAAPQEFYRNALILPGPP